MNNAAPVNPAHALQNYRATVIELDELFRALIAHADWHVPVDAAGCALLWEVSGADCIAVLAEPTPMPGGVVPHQWLPMRGRHLVRHLAPEWQGIAFEGGQPWGRAFSCEKYGRQWLELADALDVEDALVNPGPGQITLFLDHQWIVLTRDGVPCVDLSRYDTQVVHLFTADDQLARFGASHDYTMLRRSPGFVPHEPVRMNGHELFAQLAERDDYEGLLVNAAEFSYWPGLHQFLGPRFAPELHAGIDGRPGACILRARSEAEIDLFLALSDARWATHHSDSLNGTPVIRYDAELEGQRPLHWFFHPVEKLVDPEDLGSGVTEILCPGELAFALMRQLNNYYLGDDHLADNALVPSRLVRWADELLKLLPAGADLIPRHYLRTASGARLWRLLPRIRTRAWLIEARSRAEASVANTPA